MRMRTVVDTLIRENVSLMKEYLQGYDTEAAFAAQGEARNDTLLHYLKALVVYDLCARYTRQSLNETIALGREEAMRWLERGGTGAVGCQLACHLQRPRWQGRPSLPDG